MRRKQRPSSNFLLVFLFHSAPPVSDQTAQDVQCGSAPLVADRFVNWSGQGLLSLLFIENKIRSGFTQSLGRAVCVVGPMDQRQIMHGGHQVPMTYWPIMEIKEKDRWSKTKGKCKGDRKSSSVAHALRSD